MIEPTQPTDANFSVRDALGRRLEREFIAYHRRRRIVRLVSTGLAALLVFGFCGWAWWRHQADLGGAANLGRIAVEQPNPSAEDLAKNSLEGDATTAKTPTRDPRTDGTMARMKSRYRSIDVQVMTDEELEESLRELPSDWMVVSIDGELRAFHESELKPAPRRTVQVSRPSWPGDWQGG